MSLSHVLHTIQKAIPTPFSGNSTKDKDVTAAQFVERIETLMGNLYVDPQSPHRLMTVQLNLQDGALAWFSDKVAKLRADAQRTGRDLTQQPITWDTDMRRPFVSKLMGNDTVQLWLNKLSLLRLGATNTKTPIEFDSQFDSIAQRVYPTTYSEEGRDDLLLTQYYANAVRDSRYDLYELVQLLHQPLTLAAWKTALTNAWNASETLKASGRSTRGGLQAGSWRGYGGGYGGGYRGRGGGQYGSDRGDSKPAVSANAMAGDTGSGEGVEWETREDRQLNAVGNSRGGRGGRGGRGRGGSPYSDAQKAIIAALSDEERTRLLEEGKCFVCKQAGHRPWESDCSGKGKGKAGQ